MNVIQQIEAEHAAQLPGAKMPAFQPGDTVGVNVKVRKASASACRPMRACASRAPARPQRDFTVRKISYGEGVERVFPVYSPMIDRSKS